MSAHLKIEDKDLPKCVPCDADGKEVNAEFLAFIGVRIGNQEWQDWHLVCAVHRRDWAAFKLVKMDREEACR